MFKSTRGLRAVSGVAVAGFSLGLASAVPADFTQVVDSSTVTFFIGTGVQSLAFSRLDINDLGSVVYMNRDSTSRLLGTGCIFLEERADNPDLQSGSTRFQQFLVEFPESEHQ